MNNVGRVGNNILWIVTLRKMSRNSVSVGYQETLLKTLFRSLTALVKHGKETVF